MEPDLLGTGPGLAAAACPMPPPALWGQALAGQPPGPLLARSSEPRASLCPQRVDRFAHKAKPCGPALKSIHFRGENMTVIHLSPTTL